VSFGLLIESLSEIEGGSRAKQPAKLFGFKILTGGEFFSRAPMNQNRYNPRARDIPARAHAEMHLGISRRLRVPRPSFDPRVFPAQTLTRNQRFRESAERSTQTESARTEVVVQICS
jgi:hypothetical protein